MYIDKLIDDIINKLITAAIKDAIEIKNSDHVIVKCPHCRDVILIMKKEFNCKIFRHGFYKENHKQIDSHECKEECDRLKNEDLIFGCGKPFRLDDNNNAIICMYI